MTWIHPLSAATTAPEDVLGGKGHGLVVLCRLGLPVPPGFVVGTGACRAFLRDGRLPGGLDAELAAAVAELETVTGRRFGGARPLTVAVRSGAAVPMPGMMSTVLNLGLTPAATAALAAETGAPRFARAARARFLASYAAATGDRPDPADPLQQLTTAVRAVFSSWHTPRARTYREVHGIGHAAGTAVTVQAMVFGNRDEHSGTGVAFSRDPNTGEPVPFGEVLYGHQGEDVVAGTTVTNPLATLADREPAVYADLVAALARIEANHRDACSVEFTFESGRLWLLQVRGAGLWGRAAVRVAVDLADAGVIGRAEAVRRVPPRLRRYADRPRLAAADVLVRGVGACPGVATGRVATTADNAVRLAGDGPVILVRPHTSPLDMHGLAASAGVLTATGGPASHAAVVARSMGTPAVVAATALTVHPGAGLRVGDRTVGEGTVITIDGTSGEVALGHADVVDDGPDPHLRRLLGWVDSAMG